MPLARRRFRFFGISRRSFVVGAFLFAFLAIPIGIIAVRANFILGKSSEHLKDVTSSSLATTSNFSDYEDFSEYLDVPDIGSVRKSTAFPDKIYMDDGSSPVPTNQWYSSVAFVPTSEPIFALPIAVKMESDGFGVSYPDIVSTADTVFASYMPDIRMTFDRSSLPSIDSYIGNHDDLSVEVVEKSGQDTISRLRITRGSPFIFASFSPNLSFELSVRNQGSIDRVGDDCVLFSESGKYFAFFFSPETMLVNEPSDGKISFRSSSQGADFSIAVLPNPESVEYFRSFAFDPIISTNVSFVESGDRVKSRFSIRTKDGGDTIFSLLPRQVSALDSDAGSADRIPDVSYQSLKGEQIAYLGKEFSFSREVPSLPDHLDIESLPDNDKETLRELVKADVKTEKLTAEDTYFLGKQLFSMANLLDISERLGMTEESNSLKKSLRTELELWRENTFSTADIGGKYFIYDPKIRGIVGEKSSFGSDQFNDHHFHYGYFIFAASILSKYDEEYLLNNESFVNLLVKDIANADRKDQSFPYIRGFDAYEGHSWASGEGVFADGNNQESSSEAVNAWYSIFLWSEATHNDKLREESLYLVSEEMSSALEYWLNIDRNDPKFSNFKHDFVSIVWGGKLDSSTWFSDRIEAKLGIQIIPTSPVSAYLGKDINRVRENLLSDPDLLAPTMFRDYIAFYGSLSDIDTAAKYISGLRHEDIDDADSKSFLEAWIMTRKNAQNQN